MTRYVPAVVCLAFALGAGYFAIGFATTPDAGGGIVVFMAVIAALLLGMAVMLALRAWRTRPAPWQMTPAGPSRGPRTVPRGSRRLLVRLASAAVVVIVGSIIAIRHIDQQTDSALQQFSSSVPSFDAGLQGLTKSGGKGSVESSTSELTLASLEDVAPNLARQVDAYARTHDGAAPHVGSGKASMTVSEMSGPVAGPHSFCVVTQGVWLRWSGPEKKVASEGTGTTCGQHVAR